VENEPQFGSTATLLHVIMFLPFCQVFFATYPAFSSHIPPAQWQAKAPATPLTQIKEGVTCSRMVSASRLGDPGPCRSNVPVARAWAHPQKGGFGYFFYGHNGGLGRHRSPSRHSIVSDMAFRRDAFN
jgi:hypothetical protein